MRGVQRKGFDLNGKRALMVGAGGVGSAIAASLAGAGVGAIGSSTPTPRRSRRWPSGSTSTIPQIEVATGTKDPAGYDIVVNATPLGMNDGDPLPMDVDRIAPATFVGEVVMKQEITPFLRAAQEQGLPDPGRHGHAVRADPGVSGVLRLRQHDPR